MFSVALRGSLDVWRIWDDVRVTSREGFLDGPGRTTVGCDVRTKGCLYGLYILQNRLINEGMPVDGLIIGLTASLAANSIMPIWQARGLIVVTI